MPSEFDFDASTVPRPEPNETAANAAADPPDPPAGTRFRPTEKLGEGGQGEVWLALDPELDRQVALKVVRRDRLGSDATRDKLRHEAEVTGKLEHPNIVAIYEAGRQQLAGAAPYYVMRVYRKQTLEKAVEAFHRDPWSEPKLRELLQRFVDVCNAVGHAHSRGVIHRDLKPENVMLGDFGETLLVDWGLAKIVGRDEVHKTAAGDSTVQLARTPDATTAGTIMGTPRYMSPEQARGEVATLGPATDIYGLGAILYHLLTGRPPVDQEGIALHEILEHVRAGRIDAPRDRNPHVPRPLDAICRRAMSKESLDRYQTAVALADDVNCWLNDEPVAAYRDPLPTRARRWLRRHQTLAASSAVAVLVAFVTLSVLLFVVNTKNKELAESNQRETDARLLAQGNAATARHQTQLALDTLNSVIFDIQRGLEDVPGAGEVRRKILGTALEGLRQISDEFGDADVVDRQKSVVLAEIADTVLRIGLSEKDLEIGGPDTRSPVKFALSLYRRASSNLERLAAADPNNAEAQRDLSFSYNKLGDVLLQSGDVSDALAQYQKDLAISQKWAAAEPSDARAQRDLSVSYNKLGNVLLQSGRVTEALAHFEKLLEISQKLAVANPNDSQAQRDLAVSYKTLGDVLLRSGQLPEAVAHYEKDLEISQKLAAADPSDARTQRDLSATYNNLGNALLQSRRVTEALRQYERALAIGDNLGAADSVDAQLQRDLSVSCNTLADALLQSGRLTEALTQCEKALKINQRLAAADPSDAQAQRDLSNSYETVGDLLLKSGKVTDAAARHRESLKIREKLAGADPSDAESQRNLAISYSRLGDMLLRSGQVTEALAEYDAALAIREKLAAVDPSDAVGQRDLSLSYDRLGDLLLQSGQLTEAVAKYDKALEIRRQKLAATNPNDAEAQRDMAISCNKLGDLLLQSGEVTAALAQYRKLLDISQKLAATDHDDARAQRDLSVSYGRLGDALLQSGQVTEALAQRKKSLQISQKLALADPKNAAAQRDLAVSHNRLGDVLLQSRRVTEALNEYEKFFEMSQALAMAAPNDVQVQSDLMVSHHKLGDVHRELFAYEEAMQQYRAAIAVLDQMFQKGQTIRQPKEHREYYTQRAEDAELSLTATKDWETLLDEPAEDMPNLLFIRSREFAKQNRLDDAAQAAAKLRELDPADKVNLYDAACGYALCARGDAAELTPEQKQRRKEFQGLAIACLEDAIAVGWDDFEHMQKDEDLSAVRDLPKFKALLPGDSRGDAGGDGLEAKNESPDAS